MGWVGHVAHMWKLRNACMFLVESLMRPAIGGRMILKWILETGCGLDSSGSGWGPVVGSCKHDNDS
jgi:hypothetical protein